MLITLQVSDAEIDLNHPVHVGRWAYETLGSGYFLGCQDRCLLA